jgi:hypothetical protein
MRQVNARLSTRFWPPSFSLAELSLRRSTNHETAFCIYRKHTSPGETTGNPRERRRLLAQFPERVLILLRLTASVRFPQGRR